MTALTHLIDVSRAIHNTDRGQIHLEAPGGQQLMCGHGDVYRILDGERFRIWYPTERAVSCRSCTKQLAVLVRLQTGALTSVQLEELLAHIAEMRANGTNHHDKENGS